MQRLDATRILPISALIGPVPRSALIAPCASGRAVRHRPAASFHAWSVASPGERRDDRSGFSDSTRQGESHFLARHFGYPVQRPLTFSRQGGLISKEGA